MKRFVLGRRLSASLLVSLLALGALAGCGGSEDASGAQDPASPEGQDEGSDVVRLLTYDSFALDESVADTFEKETGMSIEVVAAGDSGAMLAGALLSADSPGADVIFGIDNTSAAKSGEADLLAEFQPAAVDGLPEELLAHGPARDSLTPVDTSEVCVNADAGWFAEHGIELPGDFADLADERYRDLLVVENPVNSSPGLAFMLGTIDTFGADGWLDYWNRLRELGVRVAPSWDDAYYNDYTVNGGNRPLVLSYASSPPAEVVFSEGERTEPASVVIEGTCVTQVEYAGVLAAAENPEGARRLVEFMLEPAYQRALPLSNFVYPVTDVELPEVFRRFAPRPEDPIVADGAEVEANRDTWLEQWRSVMQ